MLKHGMYGKPEYNAYTQMKQRCYNIKHKRYKNYGERGIIVCDRWLYSFQNFIEDIGKKPCKNYSLDRIDINGNYEPNNCRWSNKKEQANNRRKKNIKL